MHIKIWAFVATFLFFLCAGPHTSNALTDSQKQEMQTELHKIVSKRKAELEEQQQTLESNLKREVDDARSESRKVEDSLKFTRYWIQRRKSELADEAEISQRQQQLITLEAQMKNLETAQAELKADHKKQLQEMEQKTNEQEKDLEAARLRFKAAMLSDNSNDYDHALGIALAAFGNPDWTPEVSTTTRCKLDDKGEKVCTTENKK